MRIMCFAAERKELINAISELTGEKMKYQGPPTFQFVAGDFTVERDGTLNVENLAAHREVLTALTEQKLIDNAWDEEREVISIDLPLEQHTGLSLMNLVEMLWTKQEIINKAIGCQKAFHINERFIEALQEETPQTVEELLLLWERLGSDEITKGLEFYDNKVSFTGFPYTQDSDWIKVFADLAGKINLMAIHSKRIELKKGPIENEKYYFRVWLIRLGFGGEDYKVDRKLLLSNLSGHSAFRTEEQKEQYKEKYQEKRAQEVNGHEES